MEELQSHIFVLILAGGGGTRLWPMSRENSPKQFDRIFAGRSLFQLVLSRALKITTPANIIICTGHSYAAYVRQEAKRIPPENVLAEPFRRDTAMATAYSCAHIFHRDPHAVVVNMASDHLISPQNIFTLQIKAAARLAHLHPYLVTIGVTPKFAHTGMGHIKAFVPWPGLGQDVLVGERFVEKPPAGLAQKYTASKRYYWNSNLFVFKAGLMLDLLKKHAPKIYSMIPRIIATIGTNRENSAVQLAYQMAPKISIDYAAVEHLRKFICLPAKFNWTDVGDWNEVWKNLPHDQLGNAIQGSSGRGEYLGLDSQNNLLFLDKQLITTVGLKDMVIVDTPDVLLVCPRHDSQAVKKIVDILKDQELTKYL